MRDSPADLASYSTVYRLSIVLHCIVAFKLDPVTVRKEKGKKKKKKRLTRHPSMVSIYAGGGYTLQLNMGVLESWEK
jgi:hypothetical protein